MAQNNRRNFWITTILAIVIFFIYAIPNSQASDNPQMVQVFEPDEAAPLPYTLQMTTPAPDLDRALRQFIFYEYYYYGFPILAPQQRCCCRYAGAGRLKTPRW